MNKEIKALNERIKEESSFVETLVAEIGKVIVGQRYVVERLLVGLLCNGHILLEGVPGLANWLITTPLRVSAVCCTSVPTTVTGLTNPERGMEMNSTGMEARAQSRRFWLVAWLHLMGGVGQQERTARGFRASSSALPLTMS